MIAVSDVLINLSLGTDVAAKVDTIKGLIWV